MDHEQPVQLDIVLPWVARGTKQPFFSYKRKQAEGSLWKIFFSCVCSAEFRARREGKSDQAVSGSVSTSSQLQWSPDTVHSHFPDHSCATLIPFPLWKLDSILAETNEPGPGDSFSSECRAPHCSSLQPAPCSLDFFTACAQLTYSLSALSWAELLPGPDPASSSRSQESFHLCIFYQLPPSLLSP